VAERRATSLAATELAPVVMTPPRKRAASGSPVVA